MEKLRIQDRIGMCADTGQTCMKLNLYKKQVNALIDDGFSVQRLGAVPNYPEQGSYKIDWSEAPEGSVARHYLERSRKENDFFSLSRESKSSVSPPYSFGSDWIND